MAFAAQPEPKPVRGVKLKTVSLATILFSLLCLGAFLAGRPPLAAARLGEIPGAHPPTALISKTPSAHEHTRKRHEPATAAGYGTP